MWVLEGGHVPSGVTSPQRGLEVWFHLTDLDVLRVVSQLPAPRHPTQGQLWPLFSWQMVQRACGGWESPLCVPQGPPRPTLPTEYPSRVRELWPCQGAGGTGAERNTHNPRQKGLRAAASKMPVLGEASFWVFLSSPGSQPLDGASGQLATGRGSLFPLIWGSGIPSPMALMAETSPLDRWGPPPGAQTPPAPGRGCGGPKGGRFFLPACWGLTLSSSEGRGSPVSGFAALGFCLRQEEPHC